MARFYRKVRKFHRIAGKIIAVFIIWMLTWGFILANRESVREITHHFGNLSRPQYSLGLPSGAISVDEALNQGWKALGRQEKFKRIELKWEGGAPIYRIRFQDRHESEVTIHALSGRILIYPTGEKEFKKIAQDFHTLGVLPPGFKWVLDVLAIAVISLVVSGLILFLKTKRITGKSARKIHIISSLLISIPFLITSATGILIHHEERLEQTFKQYVSSSPTQPPPLSFSYDSLPIGAQKAVEIFQSQFSRPRVLRRAMLQYERGYGTLVWQVEPEEGMRNPIIIDAYTGQVIKTSSQLYFPEFFDQIHEWYLFGGFSKYIVNFIVLVLLVCLITGLML